MFHMGIRTGVSEAPMFQERFSNSKWVKEKQFLMETVPTALTTGNKPAFWKPNLNFLKTFYMFHNYLHLQGNRRIYKKPNCLYSLPQMSAVCWQRFLKEWEQKSSNIKKPKTSLYRNINQKRHNPNFISEKGKLDSE